MSFEEQSDFAKQVADLNRYGQALNSCETVEEVVSLTLEALSLLFDFSYATFVEVGEDGPTIANSTNPRLSPGDQPSDLAVQAVETNQTTTATGEDAGVTADSAVTATLAVPASIVEDVVVVLVIRGTDVESDGEAYARPLEILASHAATAISNIRSRQRLERARTDLEKRKEMVELYDKLLRHDLGNDLQVINGFATALVDDLEGEQRQFARRIERTAERSAGMIERVGEVVSTLEREGEPEPRKLRPILEAVVADVASQYDSLTVEFDPADFEDTVYGGDLLDSVFSNVISNAAVHTAGPVSVRVSVEDSSPDEVTVGIADDGPGIPDAVRADLFEMGAKGPDSDGSGLGLGFVRALIESYGGTVSVRESDAGGAEFRITLQRV